MPRVRRAALAVVLALSALVAGGASVSAHALLASSDPAANAVVPTPPAKVTLTFTEQPDVRLSSIQVLDASGASRTTGPAVAGTAEPDTLTVPVGPLADGVYTVAWRTVSAADGHAIAGSFAFSVGAATPPPAVAGAAAAGTSSVTVSSVLARAVMYLGLVVLLGALFAGEVLVTRRARRLARLRTLAWTLAALGAAGVLLAATADARVGLGDALGSTLGTEALMRMVPIVLAGPLLLIGGRRGGTHGSALRVAATLVAVALLADAVASHAATASLPVPNVALQWLHAVAISIWLGGLAGVVLELGDPDAGDRASLMARFSRWATAGILVVAATGAVRAASELHDPGELLSTDYGRLILAKASLFSVLAVLGAVNHFRNVPAGERGVGALRRVGSLELMVGTTIIVLAATLVTTPPPANAVTALAAIPPGPAGMTVDGNDYGTTVRLQLGITPGTAGPNAFRATVVDYDTGAGIGATSVTLRFRLPARPDVGASSLDLQRAGDGSFTGTGSTLSLAGTWTVTALVVEPTTSVEVPLSVEVAPAPSQVDVNRVAGHPTLYTVELAGGASAELYLDPWASGAADLHVTFFDATGSGLPVTSIEVTAATGGRAPVPVAMTPFEPGHAVGHLVTVAGVPISITVTAMAPDGHQVNLSLPITPDR
jgi:copper transport protein